MQQLLRSKADNEEEEEDDDNDEDDYRNVASTAMWPFLLIWRNHRTGSVVV